VDLISMKAHVYELDGSGKAKVGDIPGEMAEAAKAAHEALVEMVAEGDDKLMEEFFEMGTLPVEDLTKGLRGAIASKRIVPVLLSSALHNVGSDALLNFMAELFPSPLERKTVSGTKEPEGKGEKVERKVADGEPVSLFVWKTMADPFAGRVSYFKVMSGVLKNDATLANYTRNTQERLQHIHVQQGKTAAEIAELHAGDIGTVNKLKDTLTGDTLGEKDKVIYYPQARLPIPSITFAIEPKTRADEDKIGQAIHRVLEEDPSLQFSRDPQTKEFLLAGSGQQHIEVVVAKLSKRYHVEVTLKPPKVPYRETIRGNADAEGKHKKQTGGHGQFGVCRVKFEPMQRGAGFEFVNDIFGGAIPKNFIPAVEKGIVEAAARGYLAGFPVVDFRVILYDGSYHDVDSNELSFKVAGRLAFKKAMEQARPTLLEPIMKVEITVPDEFAGAIMGDLNSRRGRIQGMDNKAGKTVVKAEVPMAEMLTYGTDLTSMTQGRGSFNMEMAHYDIVPAQIQEKIVTAAKAARGEVAEEEE
jgi:elongation factor G